MRADTMEMELLVKVKGDIITSNVVEYCEIIRTGIDGINRDLKTDEDFGQAKADVSNLQLVEKGFTDAKADVLAQMRGVNELLKAMDETSQYARSSRLELDKLIKTREEEIKHEIVIQSLESLPYIGESIDCDAIKAAMKGKRTVDTLRAAAKAESERLTARYEAAKMLLDRAKEKHGASIVFGEAALLRMGVPELVVELERRVERNLAEAERKPLEDEAATGRAEAAKAKAEIPPSPAPEAPLPDPPKIGFIPVGKKAAAVDETASSEMTRFRNTVMAALAPVKAARMELKHAANIDAAEVFAQDIAAAWNKFKNI